MMGGFQRVSEEGPKRDLPVQQKKNTGGVRIQSQKDNPPIASFHPEALPIKSVFA